MEIDTHLCIWSVDPLFKQSSHIILVWCKMGLITIWLKIWIIHLEGVNVFVLNGKNQNKDLGIHPNEACIIVQEKSMDPIPNKQCDWIELLMMFDQPDFSLWWQKYSVVHNEWIGSSQVGL